MVEENHKTENFKDENERRLENAVKMARSILRGAHQPPEAIVDLSVELMRFKRFSYSRRILARNARNEELDLNRELRLTYFQKWAHCTYKDTDLPTEQRLKDAIRILHRAEDIKTTTNQETLRLMGAIYKRKWEVDSRTKNLELSLLYYGRGMKQGSGNDCGHSAINAAFVLDVLAHLEEGVLAEVDHGAAESELADLVEPGSRRRRASEIRESVLGAILPLEKKFEGKWWYYATVAEAFFGLGRYHEAVYWLEQGDVLVEHVPEWEKETTIRQLALLAQIQSAAAKTGFSDEAGTESVQSAPEFGDDESRHTEPEATANQRQRACPKRQNRDAWDALETLFEGDVRAVRSSFNGKIGLALSGGGFRASLFHIGTLAKLAELDVLRQVEVLSCVSGGSIIGAHYYLEIRKLLQSKPDYIRAETDDEGLEAISRQDYIDLVQKITGDFLKGVERNIRTRVASSWLASAKMVIFPNYSKTTRLGELYEKELFSRVRDGGGKKKRFISGLFVQPKGEPKDFHPRRNNWRRSAKVPDLILNATTLNTGHVWQFTCSWMGETPAILENEVDKNDRLRRMYYKDAPAKHRKIRLGDAVAASSCVPAAFEPLTFLDLYPDRIVRLVDGGVCDNQGIAGLLEQDCSVILVSDASGQMDSQNCPSDGILGVPLRSNSILQARIRDIQYHDLKKREASTLLRGLMFIHLKDGLDSNQVDWVNCREPYYSSSDSQPRLSVQTPYGIDKKLQVKLASIRTDLDSFSEMEAYTLMTSAYKMTGHAFATNEKLLRLIPENEGPENQSEAAYDWEFLRIEDGMRGEEDDPSGDMFTRVMKFVGTGNQMAFKVWRQSRALSAIGLVFTALAVSGVLLYYGVFAALFRWLQTPGIIVTILAASGAFALVYYLWQKVNWISYGTRIVIGLMMLGPGWVVSRFHLYTFDRLFLRLGRLPKKTRRHSS